MLDFILLVCTLSAEAVFFIQHDCWSPALGQSLLANSQCFESKMLFRPGIGRLRSGRLRKLAESEGDAHGFAEGFW